MPQVYLIHFSGPYKHARHYLGYSALESVADRLARHKSGNGARLLQMCNQAGIEYNIVRTWDCANMQSARALERKLKRWHKSSQLCPICNQKKENIK